MGDDNVTAPCSIGFVLLGYVPMFIHIFMKTVGVCCGLGERV